MDVTINPGTYVRRFAFWNPDTWAIPKLYWDTFSQEQRIHAICKQLGKVIAYADYVGVNVDDIASRLKAIEEGQLDPYIIAEIEQWFEDNEPEIIAAISAIQEEITTITADGWVTTNRIADGAVTGDKLAEGAISGATIEDGAVTPSALSTETMQLLFNSYAAMNGTNMVVFGDSFTAPNIANSVDAYWPKRVAATLGLTLFNFAIAGAGWGRTGQLISTQQTNCSNSMTSAQAANTSVVIAYAGYNDIVNDVPVATINAGIVSFITWAASFFPNAKIFVIPYNWGFCKISAPYNNIITNSLNSIMSYNSPRTQIVPYAWCWNLGIAARFQNEVHPGIAGYQFIAGYILNAIAGSEGYQSGVGSYLNLQNAPGLNSGFLGYNMRNGVIYVNGYIRPTNAGAQNLTIYAAGNCPAILTPYTSVFALPLLDTTNHTTVGNITFNTDGRLVANFNSGVAANDVCVFNGSFVPEVGVDWSDYV